MSAGAMLFMAGSWAFVLGLTAWAYTRILKHRRHFDPDGPGGRHSPEPPLYGPAGGAP